MLSAERDDEILFVECTGGEADGDVGCRHDDDIHGAGFEFAERVAPSEARFVLALLGQELANGDVDVGRAALKAREQRRQDNGGDAVGRADDEATGGLRWIERLRRGDDAPHPRKDVGYGGRERDGAIRGLDALWRFEKERIVEHAAQAPEAVADGGGREIERFRGAADVAGVEHGFEQDQQVEVGPG